MEEKLLISTTKFENQLNFNFTIDFRFIEINSKEETDYHIFLLINTEQILLFKMNNPLESKLSVLCSFKNGVNNLLDFSYTFSLGKLYIVNCKSLIYMIDLDRKILHNIELEPTKGSIIFKNHSYCLVGTKLVYTGGITKKGVVDNTMRSFDLANYTFEKEKLKENNMIPRHSHGSIEVLGVIYLIGGFVGVEETLENTCSKIQAIKFDKMMITWVNLDIKGRKADLLINPQIRFHRDYFIAYSDYKYSKIWYMNLCTSLGYMIDLSLIGVSKRIPNCNFSYKQEDENSKDFTCSLAYIEENIYLNMNSFKFTFS
jgi:hypothetical protein